MARSETLRVRMTREEKAAFLERARKAAMTPSALARMLLLKSREDVRCGLCSGAADDWEILQRLMKRNGWESLRGFMEEGVAGFEKQKS